MKEIIISPSILAADLARLGEEVTEVLNSGADWIHFDVMDNHYVPNLTFGPIVCKALRNYGVTAPIDVHLMVKPVDNLIVNFAQAGANIITFHPSASEDVNESLRLINKLGCKAGLAFNPTEPFDIDKYNMENIDIILLMSVEPGFGGQKFIDSVLKKISAVKKVLSSFDKELNLSVDGGITIENVEEIIKAGADVIVAGTAIFDASDYKAIIDNIRSNKL